MNHVIYRDYIVNRRFFIYCSLATVPGRSHCARKWRMRQNAVVPLELVVNTVVSSRGKFGELLCKEQA